jgi:uncharacterized membrane protein
MTPRRIALMGCFAVLMCAALWLRTATFTQSLWYDECLTARVSQVPLLQSVTEITGHNSRHLPLYYWLNHFACMVFQQDWGSRVLALLFGLLALPALMVAGRRVASGAAVAFAMLLLAISPMHVFNSHDAREYSLLMLASLVSTERLINARERDTSGAWAQYCVAVTLSLYTSFFAFLALFSQGLYMLLMQAGVLARARRLTWPAVRPLCGFAACCLTSLVLFGPMFPIMAKWVSGDVGAAPADAMAVSFQWPFFRMLLAKFGSGLGPSLWFYGIGFCAGLLFALVRNRPLFFLGVAFTVGALAPFFIILRFSKLQVFSARYIIFSLPIFLLVTA